MFEEPDLIFIPQEARGQLVEGRALSARLVNVLRSGGIQLIGQLHGLSFLGLAARRNCGEKTIQELHTLVRTVQRGQGTAQTLQPPPAGTRRVQASCFSVPPDAHGLSLSELPMSARLETALQRKGFNRIGDLHGLPFSELRRVKGCGPKVVGELVRLLERVTTGEFLPSKTPFSPFETSELMSSLDTILAKLPSRNHEIVLLRLGATDNRALTLEEIGSSVVSLTLLYIWRFWS